MNCVARAPCRLLQRRQTTDRRGIYCHNLSPSSPWPFAACRCSPFRYASLLLCLPPLILLPVFVSSEELLLHSLSARIKRGASLSCPDRGRSAWQQNQGRRSSRRSHVGGNPVLFSWIPGRAARARNSDGALLILSITATTIQEQFITYAEPHFGSALTIGNKIHAS
jgi:hypothetical protein